VQRGEVEHAALGRAEPQQRQLLDRPREDALPIGRQDRIGVQVAADRDYSFRARRAGIGELDDRHAPASVEMMSATSGAVQDVIDLWLRVWTYGAAIRVDARCGGAA